MRRNGSDRKIVRIGIAGGEIDQKVVDVGREKFGAICMVRFGYICVYIYIFQCVSMQCIMYACVCLYFNRGRRLSEDCDFYIVHDKNNVISTVV